MRTCCEYVGLNEKYHGLNPKTVNIITELDIGLEKSNNNKLRKQYSKNFSEVNELIPQQSCMAIGYATDEFS